MSIVPGAPPPQQPLPPLPQNDGPVMIPNGMANHAHFPPQPPVSLSSTIHKVIRQSYGDLMRLARELPHKSDEERKKSLVDYLDSTRERFIRLLVLVKWAHHLPNLSRTSEIINFLGQQEFFLRDAADSLCHVASKLQTARVPVYDIPTAIDVLTTGSYQRLPTMITKMIQPAPLEPEVVQDTLEKLDDHICFRLFSESVPPHITVVKVEQGRALCRVAGEYEVVLASYGDSKEPWHLVDVKLLVSTGGSSDVAAISLHAFQMQQIMRLVQDKLVTNNAQQPLVDMHNILHELVVRLMLEALRNQAHALSKDSRQFEGVKLFAKEQQLYIYYWLGGTVVTDPMASGGESTHLRIFIDDQLQLRVEHKPPLLDPTTGGVAIFHVSPANVNLEVLLLEVMHHHAYSLLHNLRTYLIKRPISPPLVVPPLLLSPSPSPSSSSPPPPASSSTTSSATTSSSSSSSATSSTTTTTSSASSSTKVMRAEQELRVHLFAGRELRVRVNNRTGRYVIISKQEGIKPDELATRIYNSPPEIVSIAEELRYQAVLSYIERQAHIMALEPYRTLGLRPATSHNNQQNNILPTTTSPSPLQPPPPTFSTYTLYLWYPEVEGRCYLAVDLGQPFSPTFSLIRVPKTLSPPNVSSLQTSNVALYNSISINNNLPPDSYPIRIDQPVPALLLDEGTGEELWHRLLQAAVVIGRRRKQYLELIDQLKAIGIDYTIVKDGISLNNNSLSRAMEISSCVIRPLPLPTPTTITITTTSTPPTTKTIAATTTTTTTKTNALSSSSSSQKQIISTPTKKEPSQYVHNNNNNNNNNINKNTNTYTTKERWTATVIERISASTRLSGDDASQGGYTFRTGKGYGTIEYQGNGATTTTPVWTFTYDSADARSMTGGSIKLLRDDLNAVAFVKDFTATLEKWLQHDAPVNMQSSFSVASKSPTHISILYNNIIKSSPPTTPTTSPSKTTTTTKPSSSSSLSPTIIPTPKPPSRIPNCLATLAWGAGTGAVAGAAGGGGLGPKKIGPVPQELELELSPGPNPLTVCLRNVLLNNVFLGTPAPNLVENIKKFLEIVHSTYPPVYQLTHFINNGIGSYLLPGDLVVIPRSVSVLTMHYRTMYGVDIKMMNDYVIFVEAAAQRRIRGLPNFTTFADEVFVPLRNNNNNNYTSNGAVSHSSIYSALQSLHSYMGALWLYRQTTLAIASELEKDGAAASSSVPPPPTHTPGVVGSGGVSAGAVGSASGFKKEVNSARLSIKLTMGSMTYIFAVVQHKRLELTVSSLQTSAEYHVDDRNTNALTLQDMSNLSSFWESKVASPPYYAQPLTSFMRLLSLPPSVLREFAEILTIENVLLLLVYTHAEQTREAITHTPLNTEVFFVIQVKASDDPSVVVEIPLRHQYTGQRTLRVAHESADPTIADVLERQLVVARNKSSSTPSPRNMYLPGILRVLPTIITQTPPPVSINTVANPGFGPMAFGTTPTTTATTSTTVPST